MGSAPQLAEYHLAASPKEKVRSGVSILQAGALTSRPRHYSPFVNRQLFRIMRKLSLDQKITYINTFDSVERVARKVIPE